MSNTPILLSTYFPVLVFLVVALLVGGILQTLGRLLAPYKPDPAKNSTYECGFGTFGDSRMKFDIRYYLIAILFIIFDLETIYFFVWGVSFRDLGVGALIVMLVFIFELAIGFWYIWKKKALDWE